MKGAADANKFEEQAFSSSEIAENFGFVRDA
jgi:hypothetical protein